MRHLPFVMFAVALAAVPTSADEHRPASAAVSLPDLAALRARAAPERGGAEQVVVVEAVAGSGKGSQHFAWDPASSDAADDWFTITPTGHAGPGRWTSAEPALTPAMGGARCDGSTDDQAALARTFAAASALHRRVQIAAGTCLHSSSLTIDGIDVSGTGPDAVLKATDTTSPKPKLAIVGKGDKLRLANLSVIATWTGVRQQNGESTCVALVGATHFELSNLTISGCGGAGMNVQLSTDGKVFKNHVADTRADGIHFTNGSHRVEIYENDISNTGDDAIAMVSYHLDNFEQSSDFQVHDNVIHGGAARGVSIVGSAKIVASHNEATGTASAGFSATSEGSYSTYSAADVSFVNNRATNCATNARFNHPQLFALATGAGLNLSRISFVDNTVSGSPDRAALRFQGDCADCAVKNLSLNGTGKIVIFNGAYSRLVVEGVNASNLADGVFEITNASGDISIVHAKASNVFQQPRLRRYLNLNGVSGLTSLTLHDQHVDGGQSLSAYGGDRSLGATAIHLDNFLLNGAALTTPK